MMNKIGRERDWSGMSRRNFDASRSLRGALVVGNAEEVTEKILMQHKIFRNSRYFLQLSVGSIPHNKVMHAIELFGTKVAPVVRRETERVQFIASRSSLRDGSEGETERRDRRA